MIATCSRGDGNVPDKEFFGGKTHGLGLLEYYTDANVPMWTALASEHTFSNDPDFTLQQWVDWVEETFYPPWEYTATSNELLSIRSGAKVSMPGMMDTILNVGITDDNYDHLRGLVGMSEALRMRVQLLVDLAKAEYPEQAEDIDKTIESVLTYYHLEDKDYRNSLLLEGLTEFFRQRMGGYPSRRRQLEIATRAVWKSYHSDRAKTYRHLNGIPDNIGTDVIAQKMVFGQLGQTGVVFSHNPADGTPGLVGESLVAAQGEALVSGDKTPEPIQEALDHTHRSKIADIMSRLIDYTHYRTIDMEFTFQEGVLYVLQVREAKLSPVAKIRMALDAEITAAGNPSTVNMAKRVASELKGVSFNSDSGEVANGSVVTTAGIGAVNGKAAGKVATTHEQAKKFHEDKVPFIWAAETTSPMDIEPMSQAVGILTFQGGALSHAAIIATEWGKPAIVGCSNIALGYESNTVQGNGKIIDFLGIEIDGKDNVKVTA